MITMYQAEIDNPGLITRQSLGQQTQKANVPKYFYKYKDGTFGIDDSSQSWKNYIELRSLKNNKVDPDSKFSRLMLAVKESIIEMLDLDEETEQALFELITEKFGG